MVNEWGRFTYWLTQNTAAIQALSAVAIVFLTSVLAALTYKSVKATEVSATTAQHQLEANLQPSIEIHLVPGADMEGRAPGRHWFSKGGVLTLRNLGATPVKLKRVALVVQRMQLIGEDVSIVHQYECELSDYTNRIIMPAKALEENIIAELQQQADNKLTVYGLSVACCDTSELMLHTFVWHPTKGVRHSMTRAKPSRT